MKLCVLFLLSVLSSAICIESKAAEPEKTQEIFAEVFEDPNACYPGFPIAFVFPFEYQGSELRSAALVLESDDIYLETPLKYLGELSGTGGSYVCIDRKNLELLKLVVSYGVDDCKGSKHAFIFEDLKVIKNDEVIYPRKIGEKKVK